MEPRFKRWLAATSVATLALVGAVFVATPAHATDATITRVQLSKTSVYGGSNITSGSCGTLAATATVGNLLVLTVSVDKASGTITWPAGYTQVAQRSGASVSMGVATKVAAGTETNCGTFGWATGELGYSAMLTEYSGASGVDSSAWAPTSYSDTAVTSLSVDPPAATVGGKTIVYFAQDSLNNPPTNTDFRPVATNYTWIDDASPTAANKWSPPIALDERNTQHAAGNNWAASTFTWTHSDQSEALVLNLAAKQLGNPPVASFTETPTSGTVPLAVQFTDTSTNTPTSWSWTFGDGGTSTAQNPSHTYTTTGTFTVGLTATNADGNSTANNTVTVNAAGSGWTNVVDDQFTTAGVPSHWHLYDGPYGSGPGNCANPNHVTAPGDGYMHINMYWDTNWCAPSGGWETGGMQIDASLGAVNQRVTVRWRITGTTTLSHYIIPMRWVDDPNFQWYQGESDYCEGDDATGCDSFLHYTQSSQIQHSYTGLDLTQWHTWRFEHGPNHVVKAYIDDMVTPVWTYNGTATTVPDAIRRTVLQQECHSSCPSGQSGSQDIQIDSIQIDNPS